MNIYRSLTSLIACVLALSAPAQQQPIGYWRSLLPYHSAKGVASDGGTIYVITNQSFFSYNYVSGQMNAYSKVEGMSDIGMQAIAYDTLTSTVVLAYENGNIDLFQDNTFYKIPELKIETIAGEKTIYAVYCRNGYAYLSTSIGVIVLDLEKQNIKETYEFNVGSQVMPVRSFVASGAYYYAATANGLYRADASSTALQSTQAWHVVDTNKDMVWLAGYDNELFAASMYKVYRLSGDTLALEYAPQYKKIKHIDHNNGGVFVSVYDTASYNGYVVTLTASGLTDSIDLPSLEPLQTLATPDGSKWVAEATNGLYRIFQNGEKSFYNPEGPSDAGAFDIYANNGDVWVAHGGYDDKGIPLGNFNGVGHFIDGKWHRYERFIYQPFNSLSDFTVLTRDELTGTTYMGSFRNGLYILNSDGNTGKLLGAASGIFDPTISLGPDERQIGGVGLDSKRNLWVSTIYSQHQLYARDADSNWYSYLLPGVVWGGKLVVDDYDQVWIAGFAGTGLTVYSANGTLADKSDDAVRHLSTGAGSGNLPSNTVNCLAKDKNNSIWVGTSNGIGIVSNCSAPFTGGQLCDADIPIVQYDQYAGYLFAANNVRALAVDGANRKWVGTDDGVWLLSADASEIVYRFTTENSPLPSNYIQSIAVDGVTGEVYIGTQQGIVCFRSTATEGGKSNKDVLAFPNPVPSGYTGTIAIKGLVANADVRITDVSGQLVYRTKALGGQAVWNGRDYKGGKPASGVYLVFASDADGNETYTGKIVILK